VKRSFAAIALVVVGGLTFAAVLLTEGEPAAALGPVAAAALLYAALFAPLRACVFSLMFLGLAADAPQDFPMNGLWHSPLYSVGELLCSNWSKTFGIRTLSFSGMDALALLLVLRTAVHPRSWPIAPPLRYAMWGFLAAIASLALWGFARGGAIDSAYWQTRQLVYLPVFAWLLSQVIDGPADLTLLAPIVLGAALLKTVVGTYFAFAVARPQGLISPVVLSHSETMLFCLSTALVVVRWLEQPDRTSLRRCLWFVPTMLFIIWLNNRRVAYVELFAALAVIWTLARWNAAKVAVARAVLLATPVLVLYIAAGWNSNAGAFKPVESIRTIVSPKKIDVGADSSTRWRDIENFNLSQTLQQHPLGIGLGHEYDEVVKAPDISADFSLYRYVPHNSVLWMMAAGGPVGFFLLWSFFVTGMFLAVRSHRMATTPLERMAAVGAACALLLFLVQAWGDMGTQNWSTTWLVSAALAVAGKLSLSTGAWPSRLRLQTIRGLRPVFALEA
jgi:hypothetical protein